MKSRLVPRLLCLALLLASVTLAVGAESAVMRIVVVETDNADAYVKEIERGAAIRKRLESPGEVRVWKAKLAGPNAGMVVVSIEYPSLSAYAKEDAKIAVDGEYQAWLKGLDKFRKVVSDSLFSELKP